MIELALNYYFAALAVGSAILGIMLLLYWNSR